MTISRRFDDYTALQLVQQGEIVIERDGVQEIATGPCLWWTYSGCQYTYYSKGASIWAHRFLSFRGDEVDEWIKDGLIFDNVFSCDAETLSWVERELDEVIEEHERIDPFAEELSRNLFERFVLKLARRRSVSPEGESLRAHLIKYLKEENYRPNGYGSLAEALKVSESTLRRRFRDEVGIPLHQFSERERVRQCKHLLRTTDATLEEVAERMSYPDVYYFSRHFTKIAGLRPGAYRRAELFGR